jgi:hypothetical protein
MILGIQNRVAERDMRRGRLPSGVMLCRLFLWERLPKGGQYQTHEGLANEVMTLTRVEA